MHYVYVYKWNIILANTRTSYYNSCTVLAACSPKGALFNFYEYKDRATYSFAYYASKLIKLLVFEQDIRMQYKLLSSTQAMDMCMALLYNML